MREQGRVLLAVARDATLARLELAYFGFNMAEYATWVAILVYAYGLGGAGASAVVAIIQLIPSGMVAPFAAYAGDRYPRDRVLVVGYVLQGVTLAAAAVGLYAGWPPAATIGLATVAAMTFTITRPVMAVLLPSLTHTPGDLTAANTVTGLVENVAKFVGPLIGGVILAVAAPGGVFVVFALLSLGSAGLVARLPAKLEAPPREGDVGLRAILAGAFGGFGVVAWNRAVLLLVVILSLTTVVVGALDILFVAVAIDLLGEGEEWAGYLSAAFGLGGVAGSFATVLLIGRRRMTPALGATGGLYGLPIAAIAVAPGLVGATTLLAASGAGGSVVAVAGQTLLQRTAPEAVLSRVFGVVESLAMFALAAGSLAAGLIVTTAGIGWALVATGLLVPVTLVATWAWLGAIDRHARAPDPEALALLRSVPIFAPLSALAIDRILAELERLQVPAGHELIRQGDPGDRFYIVISGRVEVIRDGRHVAERGRGDYFGEIALLRDVPRTATILTLTPVEVIAIERERFLEAVIGHAQSRAQAEAVAAARSASDAGR